MILNHIIILEKNFLDYWTFKYQALQYSPLWWTMHIIHAQLVTGKLNLGIPRGLVNKSTNQFSVPTCMVLNVLLIYNMILNNVTINLSVFGSLMKNQIMSDNGCCLIVTIQLLVIDLFKIKFIKESHTNNPAQHDPVLDLDTTFRFSLLQLTRFPITNTQY